MAIPYQIFQDADVDVGAGLTEACLNKFAAAHFNAVPDAYHGTEEFKDFDVVKKAGAPQKAYVESVDLDVTDGVVKITFTPNVQNPEINAIEIIPAKM